MFRIIEGDHILYESNLGLNQKELTVTHHLIMHGALDHVEEQEYLTQQMYLRRIEQSQDLGTYTYITASNTKFLIQVRQTQIQEESIKKFFQQVYELYVKVYYILIMLKEYYESSLQGWYQNSFLRF